MILSVYEISPAEWMTTQRLYLTWYPMYQCNQTHLIDDITTYVHIKSHPLQVWHHRHFIWHHIHSCWQHTIVCMLWHTLCLWHHVYYIWCHPYCVYEYPGSISDLKPIKTAISSTLYVITPSLSKTSHLLCKTSQVAYVCHHMHYTGHYIHTLWQQPLIFMTSHALYSLHHTHYIWHLIYSLWCHIHFVCYITQCFCDIKHSVYDIFTLYGITTVLWPHNHCVPSQPLCLILHSVYFRHYTQCTNFMKISECMSSQLLYIWHHMNYIWHHIHSLWHHTTLFMISSQLCLTSHPLYLTSRPLYLCNHTHSLNDIPATEVYHIQYTCDILSTIFTTSYPLCMTTQHCVLLIPHLAYVWHHLHYSDITSTLSHQITVFMMSHTLQAWHHTHCITHRTHCIFVITNSPLISYWYHPYFCMTLYPLYLRNHMHSI